MLMAIIAIIFTLILVVGIHEAGHALAARMFQVKIKKISIGFGKPLIQWQSGNGTEWAWAMWPLGGYVQLLNTRISPVEPEEYPHCFDKQPVWVRFIILIAGALANLVTAWFAFVLVFYLGLNYKVPEVQSVLPKSIASQAGINARDQFIAIDGYNTPSWQDVGMQLVILWGKKDIALTMKQPNQQELKKLTLDLSQIKFTGKEHSLLSGLGIKPDLTAATATMRSSSLVQAIHQTNAAIAHLMYFFIMILKQLFSGVIPFSILLGPLGVFAASIASLTQGIVVFCYFIASLSLAVALVNLFPVPGLDGGSIMYALVEKIRGKPISVAMEVLLHRLMVILFAVVLVNLLANDLSRFLH